LTGLGGSDTAVVFTVPLGTPAGAMNVFVRNGIQSTNTLPFTVTGSTPPPPVNKPPVANAGGPYTGTVGVPVMFNGIHSSDPDGTITGYRWEFGDGSALSAVAPLHTYTSPGTYAVTLTVTDDKGATGVAQTTATITGLVTPPPATLKVGVALESKPTGGIAVVQITDAAPLPAGSTGTFTIKTPDGRTATGTATIAGTLPPPPPPLPPASNGIDEVFEFKGTPVEQALLRAGLWEHFPWGSLKPGLQRVGLTRVRCEFADLSWVGAAMTTDDNRLIIRASMENDEGEEELFHAVWSGMLPGSDPNEPRQTVAGLAWSSGLLQVEQSIKNDQALVKLVAGFEASHMADFFLMSLPGDGPGSIHARLLALAFAPGSVTGKWWAGSYPSSAYFQSVGESWMSGMGMAYGDGVQEDRRFSPFFKAGDAATIREILGLSRI
jgi:hypothetical protein